MTDSELDELGIRVALSDLKILLTVQGDSFKPGGPIIRSTMQFSLDRKTARYLAARLLQTADVSQRAAHGGKK